MPRIKRTSFVSTATALFLCAQLLFQVRVSHGAPGSVLNATDPMRAAPALETRDLAVGDMTVASRTGAFEYSYPIAVPPGRLGNQPELALSYSSQGALRGGIAAGWSLSLPEISLSFQDGRENGGRYVSSMSGGHRLVEVTEPVYSSPLYSAFDISLRAEYDDQFIRYSIDQDADAPTKAVAMTLDGMLYFFGEKGRSAPAGQAQDTTRWPLTSTLDRFGNRVDYVYSAIPGPKTGEYQEFVLDYIEYGANAVAGIDHFARVEFDHQAVVPCEQGGLVGAGGSVDHRWTYLRS